MTVVASRAISWITLLRIGRVSNLPTVWTNALAGALIAGGEWDDPGVLLVIVAMSLFYEGGMFLNDYFDRDVDAKVRPERPIPAGEIEPNTVAAIGFGLLAGGLALLAVLGTAALLAGTLLAALIVLYDLRHKGNVFAPILMGACRALVYVTAALVAVGVVSGPLIIAALALLAYVAGLSYAAWQERFDHATNLWPLALLAVPVLVLALWLKSGLLAFLIYVCFAGAVGFAVNLLIMRPPGGVTRAVGLLIAAISLLDAAFMAGVEATGPAFLAVAAFGATLYLQRHIAGT